MLQGFAEARGLDTSKESRKSTPYSDRHPEGDEMRAATEEDEDRWIAELTVIVQSLRRLECSMGSVKLSDEQYSVLDVVADCEIELRAAALVLDALQIA